MIEYEYELKIHIMKIWKFIGLMCQVGGPARMICNLTGSFVLPVVVILEIDLIRNLRPL